jgi:hypothetical protein
VDRSQRQGRTREIGLEDPEKPVAEVASSDLPADQGVQGTQATAALGKLIAALPEKLRQPLILSAIEEISPREVAATLASTKRPCAQESFARVRFCGRSWHTPWAGSRGKRHDKERRKRGRQTRA